MDSSAVLQIEYDARTEVLSVRFVETRGRYDYYGVPKSVYDAFLASPSKGRFFNEKIKDRYRWRRRAW